MIVPNPFRCHPHYSPTVVLARFCTNVASLIWSGIVVRQGNSLIEAGTSYAWIVAVLPEEVVAWALGSIALSQTIWLLLCLPPVRFGSIGYGMLAFAWLFVLLSILFAPTINPTGAACVPIMVGLAFYGFISNPRETNDGGLAP